MEKFTNRLINETSPYLLQHAHNPVDWYAWGEEAFKEAKQEDKAIHLSIGYSACHWCHVLAHESFEDEATAELLNKNFVNIKVDREERPDLDAIYMNAVQMITGSGGWPMTVFMTPEGKPFYAGTYFPPVDRYGMPSFSRILLTVADWWRNRRSEIEDASAGIVNELTKYNKVANSEGDLNASMLDDAADILDRQADPIFGGFGSKPKFPPSMALTFLLRDYLRTGSDSSFNVLTLTLDKMARGGMYDQLGGGFHRYSVDESWLVPHFEKMLYDNALLSRIYLDTYLVTHNQFYKQIVEETLDYVVREMTDSTGGFYSSQDADSEGVEGKFFVWSKDEVINLLGEEDGRIFCRYFDVSDGGNFEEQSILNVEEGIEVIAKLMNVSLERIQEVIDRGRRILFDVREKRIKPGRDEKILTAWNGLMLRSFAEAARVLDRKDYLEIAIRNAEFLLSAMYRDGRLLRTYGSGKSKLNAYHEDYAFMIDGLLALFQTTCDRRWLDSAVELTETMIDLFLDTEEGNFYFTSKDHEQLITRNKDIFDNAIPSGNTAAAIALLKLSLITGKEQYRKIAESTLKSMKDAMVRMPSGFGNALCALDMHLYPPTDLLQCPL